jgi:hypothetical protein
VEPRKESGRIAPRCLCEQGPFLIAHTAGGYGRGRSFCACLRWCSQWRDGRCSVPPPHQPDGDRLADGHVPDHHGLCLLESGEATRPRSVSRPPAMHPLPLQCCCTVTSWGAGRREQWSSSPCVCFLGCPSFLASVPSAPQVTSSAWLLCCLSCAGWQSPHSQPLALLATCLLKSNLPPPKCSKTTLSVPVHHLFVAPMPG